MTRARLETGAVFRWRHDERPMRVLVCDRDIVMYDVWWPHLGRWGLADLQQVRKQSVSYYVTTTEGVAAKADQLRREPLTDAEVALHRPDLPLAPVQSDTVQWSAAVPENLRGEGSLDAAEIYLGPFGPNGGQKQVFASGRPTARRSPSTS